MMVDMTVKEFAVAVQQMLHPGTVIVTVALVASLRKLGELDELG